MADGKDDADRGERRRDDRSGASFHLLCVARVSEFGPKPPDKHGGTGQIGQHVESQREDAEAAVTDADRDRHAARYRTPDNGDR